MAKKKSKRTPGKKVLRKDVAKKKAARRGGTAGGPSSELAQALGLLAWSHETTGMLCAGFSEEKLTFRTGPSENHLLWTIGHLATFYSWAASLIDGKRADLPTEYDSLFGYKSTPVDEAKAYPSSVSVRQMHDRAYARLLEAAQGIKADQLHLPLGPEAHGWASSRLDVLHKAVWHEGWHQGQISSLRRALGLPGVM